MGITRKHYYYYYYYYYCVENPQAATAGRQNYQGNVKSDLWAFHPVFNLQNNCLYLFV
jgi:hypothetical protein